MSLIEQKVHVVGKLCAALKLIDVHTVTRTQITASIKEHGLPHSNSDHPYYIKAGLVERMPKHGRNVIYRIL